MAEGKLLGEQFDRIRLSRTLSAKPKVPPKPKKEVHSDPYVLVAALDFGTTFSGYAFAFKSSPNDIHMNRNWGENLGFASYKTPTCVLTGPKHEFLEFGHVAEERFTQLIEESEPCHHHMYRHFKMLLHRKSGLSRNTLVTSESGYQRPAIEIFVMAIKYLKEHLLSRISEMVASKPDEKLIRWVLTVPAIWSEGAKQFMREAAFQAGLITSKDSNQLIIALEPEAASLYCRRKDVNAFVVKDDLEDLSFQPNTKYLVIDAGGGTVDITAHQILETDEVKELNVANGGSWGGIEVDKKFLEVLDQLLGKDFMSKFKNDHPSQFLSFMTNFEKAKKQVNFADENSRIAIQVPWSMGNIYREFYKKDIDKGIAAKQVQGLSFNSGALLINHAACIGLFTVVLSNIKNHVTELLKSPNLAGLSYVMLVGGFGESKLLQQSLKEIMPDGVNLIVPAEPQLAVIKGAVYFGFNSNEIKSRMARQTYGTDTMRCFDEEKHDPKRKKILGQGKEWCDDVFRPFVTKGEPVQAGQVIEERRTPVYDQQKGMTVDIFCTDKDDLDEVEYVDRPYMNRLGGIYVPMPHTEKNLDRSVKLKFMFGGTEIKVQAIDNTSGNTAEIDIDFLTDYS